MYPLPPHWLHWGTVPGPTAIVVVAALVVVVILRTVEAGAAVTVIIVEVVTVIVTMRQVEVNTVVTVDFAVDVDIGTVWTAAKSIFKPSRNPELA